MSATESDRREDVREGGTMTAINRRQFVGGSLAAGAGVWGAAGVCCARAFPRIIPADNTDKAVTYNIFFMETFSHCSVTSANKPFLHKD